MKEKLKIAFIGYGIRGQHLMDNVLNMKDIEIVAVCDSIDERRNMMEQRVVEKYGHKPFVTADYNDIIRECKLDAVIVATFWSAHVPITIDFMKAGVPVGFEVGGCDSVEECWELVRAYRETGVECMMLENCCYNKEEMMILNMVKKGLFGEIVHCEGGYRHDLREEILTGKEKKHYRLAQYLNRNCDNYPTHALGPISKLLDINNGNRMLTLTSTASKAAGLKDYIRHEGVENKDLNTVDFRQGDVVTTVIKCYRGETITLTLDTCLPRFYSRNFNVCGTRALYDCDMNALVFAEQCKNGEEVTGKEVKDNVEEYREQYEHPLWKEYQEVGISEGHGGMDWLVLRAFFESVKAGTKPPIDVYDAVSWMVITPLSEASIAKGSMPMEIPDFTYGSWIEKKDIVKGKYSLDMVCVDTDTKIYPD